MGKLMRRLGIEPVGRLLCVCGLAWIANGCAYATPRVWHWAGSEIQPMGVHHATVDERSDQLYLDVQHVSGLDTGMYSFDVPFDWQGLPRHMDDDSVPSTDTRIPARLAPVTHWSTYVVSHLRVIGSDPRATPPREGSWGSPNRFYGIQRQQGHARSLTITSFGLDSVGNRWVRLGSDSVGCATGVPFLRKCAAAIATPATIVFDALDTVGLLILWGVSGD